MFSNQPLNTCRPMHFWQIRNTNQLIQCKPRKIYFHQSTIIEKLEEHCKLYMLLPCLNSVVPIHLLKYRCGMLGSLKQHVLFSLHPSIMQQQSVPFWSHNVRIFNPSLFRHGIATCEALHHYLKPYVFIGASLTTPFGTSL